MIKMENNNILYFESAGWDYESETSDVKNYRIRTAFLNNDNKAVYLEICGHEFDVDKKKNIKEWRCFVNYAFYIPESIEDEINYLKIKIDFNGYSKKEITKWINKNFNCGYDTIDILDSFYGYRVHADNDGYNLIDNFVVDHERAALRKAVYNKIDLSYRKALNSKYSVISLMEMNDDTIKIRCHASDMALKGTELERNLKINIYN